MVAGSLVADFGTARRTPDSGIGIPDAGSGEATDQGGEQLEEDRRPEQEADHVQEPPRMCDEEDDKYEEEYPSA